MMKMMTSDVSKHNGYLVNTGAEYVVPFLVPFEGKYWTLVLAERTHQLACPSNRNKLDCTALTPSAVESPHVHSTNCIIWSRDILSFWRQNFIPSTCHRQYLLPYPPDRHHTVRLLFRFFLHNGFYFYSSLCGRQSWLFVRIWLHNKCYHIYGAVIEF